MTVFATPLVPADNPAGVTVHAVAAGATADLRTLVTPAGLTNAWLRVRRRGAVLTTYRSTNGTDWTEHSLITGDGTLRSFNDTAGANRFYRVITP